MLEKENSTDTHLEHVVEHQPTHFKANVGSSLQAIAKVYATTAEAIANFKPTHREVISGIAPHVFDERKRRRSQRRASPSSRTYWCEPGGEKRPSPLRGMTVSPWDEHSIFLDQADPQQRLKENAETPSPICTFTSNAANVQEKPRNKNNNTMEKISSESDNLKTEARWKYLRIDTHLFKLKTIAVKLRYTRAR